MPVSVSPSTVTPGSYVTVQASGRSGHNKVDIFIVAASAPPGNNQVGQAWHGVVTSVPATWSKQINMPAQPGQYRIQIWQDGGYADQSNVVTVAAPVAAAAAPSVGPLGVNEGIAKNGASFASAPAQQQQTYLQYNGNDIHAAAAAWVRDMNAAIDQAVAAAVAAAAAAASQAPPPTPAGLYTAPSPEPAASDGQKLSMQDPATQAYYVSNYGPGYLAATQFVLDHEHQLAAIGTSHGATAPTATYNPPNPEPAASNGQTLSLQDSSTQAYYVAKAGPGILAATAFVNDLNVELGTAAPFGGTYPAGPGVGGADVGLGGTGTWSDGFSSSGGTTTGLSATASAGGVTAGAGLGVSGLAGALSGLTSNPTALLVGAGVVAYLMFGGRRR